MDGFAYNGKVLYTNGKHGYGIPSHMNEYIFIIFRCITCMSCLY